MLFRQRTTNAPDPALLAWRCVQTRRVLRSVGKYLNVVLILRTFAESDRKMDKVGTRHIQRPAMHSLPYHYPIDHLLRDSLTMVSTPMQEVLADFSEQQQAPVSN